MTDPEATDGGCPADLDPAAFLEDPDVELRRCADQHWWTRGIDLDGSPSSMVLGWEATRDVLTDGRFSPRSFADDMVANGLSRRTAYQVAPLFSLHGTEHRRQRRILSVAFTPKRVEAMRPAARQVTERLAASIASSGGECEFVAAFAAPLPPEVFAALFGLPVEDAPRLAELSTSVAKAFSSPITSDEVDEIESAAATLRDYGRRRIEIARHEEGDDLVSRLLAVDDDGEQLTEDEVLAMITGFVFAGAETTRRQLTAAIEVFAEHADEWERLAAEPALIPNAVEEVMRLRPIVPGLTRRVEEPFERGDLRLDEGERLLAVFTASNHDPEQFPEPGRFDIERAEAATHLTFGWGPHHCVGAGLARMEMTEALRSLTATFGPPVIERVGPTSVLLAPDQLWVRFPVR